MRPNAHFLQEEKAQFLTPFLRFPTFEGGQTAVRKANHVTAIRCLLLFPAHDCVIVLLSPAAVNAYEPPDPAPKESLRTVIRTVLPVLLTLLVAGVIVMGTLSPPGNGAPLPLTDKQLHMLSFAALVLPISFARFRTVFWLAPLALAFGGVIELIQPVVGRSAEWGDFLADAAGIALGLLPGWVRHRL